MRIKGKRLAAAAAVALAAALALPCGAALADEAKRGWSQDAAGWHYVKADGSAAKGGWLEVGGKWYLFDGAGAMATGWQQVGGSWYYLKGSGAMATGWAQVGGQWYYLKASGAMATGWYTVDGEWNWSDGSGVWHANKWAKDSKGWWYSWADGTYPRNSWQKIDGSWYHFNYLGYMETGLFYEKGNFYRLRDSGQMVEGWYRFYGAWQYYIPGSGVQAAGWHHIDGSWYYFLDTGLMEHSEWVGDYYVDSDGRMATNRWVGDRYVGPDGKWIPGYQEPEDPSKPNTPNDPEEDSSKWTANEIKALKTYVDNAYSCAKKGQGYAEKAYQNKYPYGIMYLPQSIEQMKLALQELDKAKELAEENDAIELASGSTLLSEIEEARSVFLGTSGDYLAINDYPEIFEEKDVTQYVYLIYDQAHKGFQSCSKLCMISSNL